MSGLPFAVEKSGVSGVGVNRHPYFAKVAGTCF